VVVMPAWGEFGCTYGDRVGQDAAEFRQTMEAQGIDTSYLHPRLPPCDWTDVALPDEPYHRNPIIQSDCVPEPWGRFQQRMDYARRSLMDLVRTLPTDAVVYVFTHSKVLEETIGVRLDNGSAMQFSLDALCDRWADVLDSEDAVSDTTTTGLWYCQQ
jgi:hypothetical protein